MKTRTHPLTAALIAAMVVALTLGHIVPYQGRTYVHAAMLNVGHVLGFAAAALLLTARPLLRGWPWWTGAAVLSLMGLLLEAAQILTTRDASFTDWIRDLAGIAIGVLLALSIGRGWRRSVMLLVSAFLVFWVAAFAPLRLVLSYELRDRAFPIIDDLSGEWRYRLRPIESTLSVDRVNDTPVLSVDLSTARFSGVAWTDPAPDWRGYKDLVLFIRPADHAPIDMTLRIHDARHNQEGEDRFRRAFTVPVDGVSVAFALDEVRRAPSGREMDLSAIRGVILYAKELDRERIIEVSVIRLR